MQVANIRRILCFREVNDYVFTQNELLAKFHFEPDGSNFYYGLNSDNQTRFATSRQALDPVSHRPFFDDLLQRLTGGQSAEKTAVLGVEPLEPGDPYGFVASNLDLVQALALELADYQARAAAAGGHLRIVVRYASEMNDPMTAGKPYGGQPAAFQASFATVRQIFQSNAHGVRFSFSPALRADVNESAITSYWPGDTFVDIIGGTGYVHGAAQVPPANAVMKAYFRHRIGAAKPFALDEMSGRDGADANDDQFLRGQLQQLASLAPEGVSFDYVTIFLQRPWGGDASLSFLL